MGRMKEIFMEVQEKFDGNIPDNFDFDAFIAQKVAEMKQPKEVLSNMNSSVPFDFSIDNDNEPADLISTIDSAAQFGWKVKLVYHETFGKNWLSNRGETNHFVTE